MRAKSSTQRSFMEPTGRSTYYEDIYGVDGMDKDRSETYAFDFCDASSSSSDSSGASEKAEPSKSLRVVSKATTSHGTIRKPTYEHRHQSPVVDLEAARMRDNEVQDTVLEVLDKPRYRIAPGVNAKDSVEIGGGGLPEEGQVQRLGMFGRVPTRPGAQGVLGHRPHLPSPPLEESPRQVIGRRTMHIADRVFENGSVFYKISNGSTTLDHRIKLGNILRYVSREHLQEYEDKEYCEEAAVGFREYYKSKGFPEIREQHRAARERRRKVCEKARRAKERHLRDLAAVDAALVLDVPVSTGSEEAPGEFVDCFKDYPEVSMGKPAAKKLESKKPVSKRQVSMKRASQRLASKGSAPGKTVLKSWKGEVMDLAEGAAYVLIIEDK